MQSAKAMAFYNQHGLVPAWNHARFFGGAYGRVGTLPDVIEARLKSGANSVPWTRYFTTLTAEFVGESKAGNPIIIVAHGIGPMSSPQDVVYAHKHGKAGKTEMMPSGRIDQEEFRDLESGAYGPVSVVDLQAYKSRYKYPFLSILTLEEAIDDPLVKARFGPKAEEYLRLHAHVAQIECKEANKRWPVSDEIVRMEGKFHLYKPGDRPHAHLVWISSLMRMSSRGISALICDVGHHSWNDGVRMLGIREGSDLSSVHPGPEDLERLMRKDWQRFMKPGDVPCDGFWVLMKLGYGWFTQCPKKGSRMDTGVPEHRVDEITAVGEVVSFRTTIGGYHGFLKYDIKEVEAIKPAGANAYQLVGQPRIVSHDGDPKWHEVPVQFFRVKLRQGCRMHSLDEVARDFDLTMRLLDGATVA